MAAIIEIKHLAKQFNNHILFDDVSLAINQGECIGIVGGNGSGKSVLFQLISGLAFADTGEILVRQKAVGKGHDFPTDLGIFVNQPGYIEFYDGFTNLQLLASIQNKIDDMTIREYMQRIGLDPYSKVKVKNYSAGMKQKLGIVQAIMENQDIILLDEPFNALDFQTNVEIMKILEELKSEGKTILLTSHQHEFLEQICNHLYLILNHKIVPFDDELKKNYFALFK